jgi:hypothetical protein
MVTRCVLKLNNEYPGPSTKIAQASSSNPISNPRQQHPTHSSLNDIELLHANEKFDVKHLLRRRSNFKHEHRAINNLMKIRTEYL